MKTKSALPTIVGSLVFLTACGSSPPGAEELAGEVIDAQESTSPEVKACMHEVLDNFEVTEGEKEAGAGENLDDVATKADEGNEEAQKVIDRFEAELADCNQSG